MPIPVPEPGLVISYAYIDVTVLPVTHRLPDNADRATEIPPVVKRHLGLDEARSSIVVAEGNDFLWPGYDLRKVAGADRYDYGFLPPRFFHQVMTAFDRLRAIGKARLTPQE